MDIDMTKAIKDFYKQAESVENAKALFGETHPIIEDELNTLDEKWHQLCEVAEFLYGEV